MREGVKGCGGCSHERSRSYSTVEAEQSQPFPTKGMLGRNRNMPLALVKRSVATRDQAARSYIVRSVVFDSDRHQFVQNGCAPNFQGGRLTLCTCKHQMRASLSVDEWQGIWIVGLTSRTIWERRHWLFYLAKVASAFESHADLWSALKTRERNAKAADLHFLGDVFRPASDGLSGAARYLPSRYVAPTYHAHRRRRDDRGWQNDISYKHAQRKRPPPLLLADPKRTFLWDQPSIFLPRAHCRDFAKWSSLQELLELLEERM